MTQSNSHHALSNSIISRHKAISRSHICACMSHVCHMTCTSRVQCERHNNVKRAEVTVIGDVKRAIERGNSHE